MEIIDSLTRKVHEAARTIRLLQEERARLVNEIEHLKLQLHRYQDTARENDTLKRNQEAVRSRLIRIQKKLDKQLVLNMNTEVPHEEPVQ